MNLPYKPDRGCCLDHPQTNESPLNMENSIIRRRIMDTGQKYDGRIGVSEIIFVMKGSAILECRNFRHTHIKEGMAFLLPIGSGYNVEVIDEMRVIICALDDTVRLCDHYTFEALLQNVNPDAVSNRIIRMNDKVLDFIRSTLIYIEDGLYCEHFLRMKIVELFHIFRAYYPREDIASFFLPLMTKDARFANFVYDKWASVKSLNELASLYNLSLSGFTKKFKKVFGMAPYQWIMDKKAERIYSELNLSDKSLKQLSIDYNFCSVQHFCDYCKKRFGVSPGKLRNHKASCMSGVPGTTTVASQGYR